MPEHFDDVIDANDAAAVVVTAGADTNAIDVSLTTGDRILVRVKDRK